MTEISQEDQTAQELLVSYHGADLTSKLAGSDEEDKDLSDLLTSMFLDYKRWVVARFPIEVALRDVTMDEVRQHRYPANTAWVVVDNDVFDITCKPSFCFWPYDLDILPPVLSSTQLDA